MDIMSILQMMGAMGNQQGQQGAQQAPQQAQGAGYGLGQPVVGGQMGNASYAAPTGAQPSILSQLLGGAGAAAAMKNPQAMGAMGGSSPLASMLLAYLQSQNQVQPPSSQPAIPYTSNGSMNNLPMQKFGRLSM